MKYEGVTVPGYVLLVLRLTCFNKNAPIFESIATQHASHEGS